MNKILFLIFACLLMSGCRPNNWQKPPDPHTSLYQGTHILHQIGGFKSVDSNMHGTFFLIVGGISGESTTNTKVSFAWLGNDGQYRFTTLPIEMIHIKIDENISAPTVNFRWGSGGFAYDGIIYALITVRVTDWPTTINIPNVGK